MSTIREIKSRGGVFALGNFDGVHRGHQGVIKATLEKAHALGVPARVMTLEPHPRTVLKPYLPPFRLTPAACKERWLRAYGLDDVVVEDFTEAFLHISAADFVKDILLGRYGVQHVIAGFDYVFGFQRSGTMKHLREWLAPHGVGVTEVTPYRDATGEVMSSSRTREALQAGDVKTATHILGRPWSITGVVEHGAARGRSISVPTANIALGDFLRPKFGVYAVQGRPVGSKALWQGVANIGTRPTVDGVREGLEAHFFDFNEDIYGQAWEVELIDFIRPEQQFPSFDRLREQIMQDIETARQRFALPIL